MCNVGCLMLLEGGLDWKFMGFLFSDMEFYEIKLVVVCEIV